MEQPKDNMPTAIDENSEARDWVRRLDRYRSPSNGRGSYELAITAIPLVITWALTYWSVLQGHIWLYAPMLVLSAGFLVRLFLIQHDCGHRAFFASRRANDCIGRILSVFTLTPYDYWRRAHAIHHATHGNLGRRGVGDVDTLTVAEYLARSRWSRLRYRAYRHPLVMFGIGPAFIFVIQHRFPMGFMRDGWLPWASTMGTNVAIAGALVLSIWAVGPSALLLVHVPILLLGAAVGVWLFYVQHQFEHTYWERPEAWNVREGALRGSSHYCLPGVLKWFTANIGVHHIHHLSSQIPYYRLPTALREHPELNDVNRLTLIQSLRCVRLALWDEESRRLISFKELHALRQR